MLRRIKHQTFPKGAQRVGGPQKVGEGFLEVTAGFGQAERRRADTPGRRNDQRREENGPEPVALCGVWGGAEPACQRCLRAGEQGKRKLDLTGWDN